MLSLPIPQYNSGDPLHQAIIEAPVHAEAVASQVPLRRGEHFVRTCQRVRAALREDGVAQRMDDMVAQLLG
jgi:hypothetical protein